MAYNEQLLERIEEFLIKKNVDVVGKKFMGGFVFVDPIGFAEDNDLDYWIQLCIDHNPFAKKVKRNKRLLTYRKFKLSSTLPKGRLIIYNFKYE